MIAIVYPSRRPRFRAGERRGDLLTWPGPCPLSRHVDRALPDASPLPDAGGEAHARREAERRARDERLAALLLKAADADASAFEAFYDATIPYAQSLARRMLALSDIDDVLSDAYFQVWREAPRFEPARGSAVTWLLTIVRTRALDLLRRQRATRECEIPDELAERPGDLPGPQELLAGTESGSALHRALATLSAQERWLLGLAYFKELSHAQISATTGLPLGTVKSSILRAQGKLRQLMADGAA